MVGCGKCGGDLARLAQNNEIFLIRSEIRIDMKENNQNYPYKFFKVFYLFLLFILLIINNYIY